MNNSNISILLGQRYDDPPDQTEEPVNFQDKIFNVLQNKSIEDYSPFGLSTAHTTKNASILLQMQREKSHE